MNLDYGDSFQVGYWSHVPCGCSFMSVSAGSSTSKLVYNTHNVNCQWDTTRTIGNLCRAHTICNTTKFVPTLVRDEVPVGGHQLSNTFQQMGIQMSCGTKAEMDNAVAACDCANNPVSRDLSLSSPSLSSCTQQRLTLLLFFIFIVMRCLWIVGIIH